jgi:hypothetical protein
MSDFMKLSLARPQSQFQCRAKRTAKLVEPGISELTDDARYAALIDHAHLFAQCHGILCESTFTGRNENVGRKK